MEYFVKGLEKKEPEEKLAEDKIYNTVKEVLDSECPNVIIERDRLWKGGVVDFTVVAYIPQFKVVIDRQTTSGVIKMDYFERVGIAYFSEGKSEQTSKEFKSIVKSQLISARDSFVWR